MAFCLRSDPNYQFLTNQPHRFASMTSKMTAPNMYLFIYKSLGNSLMLTFQSKQLLFG